MTDPDPRSALAAEAWRAIFDFITTTAHQRTRALADLGLTVADSRALGSLDQSAGRTMRSLADEWSCDASTATWIVDRLERRGYAERRADSADRRVRLATLTELGKAVRDEMLRRMYAPPPELLALDEAVLEELCAGVRRLPRG